MRRFFFMSRVAYLDLAMIVLGLLLVLSGKVLYGLLAFGLALAFHDWDYPPSA